MTTPAVNPANLPIGQITEAEILEYCDLRSVRTDSFSVEQGNSQVTYYIPGDKLKAFVLYALGGAYVGSGFQLCRLLPMYHPIWTWMNCTKIVSINGEGFDGDDTAAVIYADQVTPAKWKKYVVVLGFDQLDYDVLPDSDATYGGLEYKRYCSLKLIPNVQLVGVDSGSVTYDADAGDTFKDKPTIQAKARRETAGVEVTWHHVPAELLYERNKLPRKMLAKQGYVNSEDPWLGEPAETLLLEDIDLGERFVFPFITDAVGQLYYGHNVKFRYLWYDPTPKGKTGETRHGWNFSLYAGNLKYYYSRVTSSGLAVFQSTTFAPLFTHWSL
jgi:hypothetical protein